MNGILFVALKVATTLSSIGIYLSPVPSMRRILKNKSPGQMQLIPLVVLFVNCYQKMLYGIFINDIFPLVFTMLVGEVCAVVYVGIFTKVTSNRDYVVRICMVGGLATALLTLYSGLAWTGLTHESTEEAGDVLGCIGVLTSIGTVMSPLMTARKVVRTKDASSIPIELCSASLVSSALWMLYGLASNEVFVWAPNVVCVFMALAQILLYVKYNPNKRPETTDPVYAISLVCVSDETEISKPSKGEFARNSPSFHALQSP